MNGQVPAPHRAHDGDAEPSRPTRPLINGNASGARQRRDRPTRRVRLLGAVTGVVTLAYGSIIAIQLYAWSGGRSRPTLSTADSGSPGRMQRRAIAGRRAALRGS